MIKIFKRTTDNKYLQSLENDIWVEDIKESIIMNFVEAEEVKKILLQTYTLEQLNEIVDLVKIKPLTKEEKKQLRNLIKE